MRGAPFLYDGPIFFGLPPRPHSIACFANPLARTARETGCVAHLITALRRTTARYGTKVVPAIAALVEGSTYSHYGGDPKTAPGSAGAVWCSGHSELVTEPGDALEALSVRVEEVAPSGLAPRHDVTA